MSDNGDNRHHDEQSHQTLHYMVFSLGWCILSAVINLIFLWPQGHFLALVILALSWSLPLIYELEIRRVRRGWTAAAVFLLLSAAIMTFYIIGPIVVPPYIGWLQPADDPTPPNACSTAGLAASGVTVLLGDSAFAASARFLSLRPSFVPLSLACGPAITAERGPNGLRITAAIHDIDGTTVGSVINNKFNIPSDSGIIVEKSGDLSTLVVHNSAGSELFFVKYLNENAIRIRGIFACSFPIHQYVFIDNVTIRPLNGLHHFCALDVNTGISLGPFSPP